MARWLVGIVSERMLVTVPVGGVIGCGEFTDCCPGSGSGSGCGSDECVTTCPQCPTGTSGQWVATIPGRTAVVLCYDSSGADGTNFCTWNSSDLVWTLYFDADGVWLLVNRTTNEVWFLGSDSWDCNGENTMTAEDGGDPAVLDPTYDCTEISYNCTGGSCVMVAGTGGTYPTLAECQAACTGDPVTACGCDVPRTLYAHFSGALAALGTVRFDYESGLRWVTVLGGPPGCGITGTIAFECVGGAWHLIAPGPNTSFNVTGGDPVCSPFAVVVSGTASGTCSGAFTAVVDTTL